MLIEPCSPPATLTSFSVVNSMKCYEDKKRHTEKNFFFLSFHLQNIGTISKTPNKAHNRQNRWICEVKRSSDTHSILLEKKSIYYLLKEIMENSNWNKTNKIQMKFFGNYSKEASPLFLVFIAYSWKNLQKRRILLTIPILLTNPFKERK